MQLAWLLSCCVGKGLVERAHSYKDNVAKGIEPTMGLFNYPVLMAADILFVTWPRVRLQAGQPVSEDASGGRPASAYSSGIGREVAKDCAYLCIRAGGA